MKKYFFISLLLVSACNTAPDAGDKGKSSTSLVNNPRTANGIDTVSAARKATMDFADTIHEFGKMNEGEKVTYDFTFVNNGKTPLIILSATGSCGCTVPEYPKDPVEPGKSGIIKVTFNSASKNGHQEKSVTLRDNTMRGVHYLYIKGEVNNNDNK